MDRRGRALRLAGAVVVVMGFAFVGVGAWLGVEAMRFQAGALRAEGEVVRLERNGDGAAPVFRFTTAAGATQEATHGITASPPAWRIGERATLLYRPEAPADARPDSPVALWLFPGVFLAVGLVEFLAATLLFTLARRQARG